MMLITPGSPSLSDNTTYVIVNIDFMGVLQVKSLTEENIHNMTKLYTFKNKHSSSKTETDQITFAILHPF